MSKEAVSNIEAVMDSKGDYRESIADLIADILHWCQANNKDFNQELTKAKLYVEIDNGKYDHAQPWLWCDRAYDREYGKFLK